MSNQSKRVDKMKHDYKKLIKESYEEDCSFNGDEYAKAEFLADNIFDFVTYDGEVDKSFVDTAIEVVNAISTGTTFEYISDKNKYKWYIAMCNMPFFRDRIEWGTSIRGAFWECEIKLNSCGIFEDGEQILDMSFSREEWELFMKAVKEFYEE